MGTVSHFRVLGCKARGNHKPFGAETDGSPAALMNCRHSSSKISLSGKAVAVSRRPRAVAGVTEKPVINATAVRDRGLTTSKKITTTIEVSTVSTPL
jgi:hypothetical protein